jgi:hypothetical protein
MDYQFDCRQTEKWKSYLQTQGFVVITGILTEPEIQAGLATCIEQFGHHGFTGFIDDVNFSYSDFVWSCRTNPKVLKVYQQLYNLDSPQELITAIDRGSVISNVPSVDIEESTAYWLHVDYPLLDVGKHDIPRVYQSILSFVDSGGSKKPGLRVVPRSATAENHDRILRDNQDEDPEQELTYWLLSAAHTDELQSSVVEVESPAGSLTLWLSGLIHDSTTAVYQSDKGNRNSERDDNKPLARVVVYLCYAPKAWATAEELELRQLIYKRGQITTHWPCLYLSLHEEAFHRWAWRKMAATYPTIQQLIPLSDK